jgi:hypothetical protein
MRCATANERKQVTPDPAGARSQHPLPNAGCNRVLRNGLTHAHAGVETFGDYIDEANIDADFHVEV